jgi:hypothetical protein
LTITDSIVFSSAFETADEAFVTLDFLETEQASRRSDKKSVM